MIEPLLVSAEDAARLIGISRSKWYQLYNEGVTPLPVKLGRRSLWVYKSLQDWVAGGCKPRDTSTLDCRGE